MAITNYNIKRKFYVYKSYISLFIAVFIKLLGIYNIHFIAQQSFTFFTLTIGMSAQTTLIILFIKIIPLIILMFFNFLGSYSFEIYIFDAFYFRDLKICLELSSPCLHLPLYLIFTCMSAYHCKQLVNKLPQLR